MNDLNKTYSSQIEDLLIRHLLPYDYGHYVDVGAFHPVKQSNTYSLYLRGWDGVLIEPQPAYTRLLREHRPRDICVEKAVSDTPGQQTMRLWWGASSLEASWPIPEQTPDGDPVGTMNVETDTLAAILYDHATVRDRCDLCSIDVEGFEAQVIRSIDFTTFRPALFVIESVEWKSLRKTHRDWEPTLLEHGYEFATDNYANRFYFRSERQDIRTRLNQLDNKP